MKVLSNQWNSPNNMERHARNFVKNFLASPTSQGCWAGTYSKSCPVFSIWDMEFWVFYELIENFKSEFFPGYIREQVVGGSDGTVLTLGGGFYDGKD